MSRLDRYVLRQLLAATITIPAILLLLLWVTRSLRFIDLVVDQGVPLSAFFQLSVLTLPQSIALILPLSLFVATLLTYQKLITDSELVIMRAAGLSPLGVARPAIIAAAASAAVTAALTLWVAPAAETAKRDLQQWIDSKLSTALVETGKFSQLGNGHVAYARTRTPQGDLAGLMIHQNYRRQGRSATMFARRGQLLRTQDSYRVTLRGGSRQEYDRAQQRLSVLFFDEHTVDLGLLRKGLGQRSKVARERSLAALLAPSGHVVDLDTRRKWRAVGHERLLKPLYVFAFMLVAVAALLAGEHGRGSLAKRIISAVAIAVVAQASAMALTNAARQASVYIALAYGLAGLMIVGALAAMYGLKVGGRQ